jgi:thiamine monophosphate synthase
MNVAILKELQASGDRKIILLILQDALHIAQNPHCRGVHICPKQGLRVVRLNVISRATSRPVAT